MILKYYLRALPGICLLFAISSFKGIVLGCWYGLQLFVRVGLCFSNACRVGPSVILFVLGSLVF